MTDEDLTIRANIDASGTQSGAAQAAAAFQQMKAAQDDVAASAAKATVAQEALAASSVGEAASIRGLAAAHRELAAAMAVRPSGVAFSALESAANRVAEAYSTASRAASGVGTELGAATFATPPALAAMDRSLRQLPQVAEESAAGIATAFASAPVPRGTFTAITKDLQEVQNVGTLAASGVATAFAAAAVPQQTLAAVTQDLSTAMAAEATSAGAIGVALGEGAAVSSTTLASVGRDLAKTQTATEQASHGIRTAMDAAFVAPAALRTLGSQVQQQTTMAERATHGITTALQAAFVTPPALRTLGQDIVNTLGKSSEEGTSQLAAKIITAGNAAGVGFSAASKEVRTLAAGLENAAEGAVHLNLATSGAIREFLVLGHEAMSGNLSRVPGSMVVLAERTGGLHTIFQFLTAANIAMGVAALAAAGSLGYLIYQLYEEKRAIEEISASMLLTGQVGPSMNFDVIRESIRNLKDEYGASTSEARAVAAAFASVTGITDQQRQRVEGLALAWAHYTHGDVDKVAAEIAKRIDAGSKSLADYLVKLGGVTEAEKTRILTTQGEGQATQTLLDKFIEFVDRAVGGYERLDTKAKDYQRTLMGIAAGMGGDPFAAAALERAFPEAQRPERPGTPGTFGATTSKDYSDFLQSQLGYTQKDAAALVGQFQQESSLNPADTRDPHHRGLANWDDERFAKLQEYAKSIGTEWTDWQTQLRFANVEIQKMAPEFFKVNDLAEKTRILTGKFEIPKKPGQPGFEDEVTKRLTYSQAVLAQGPVQRQSPQEADVDRATEAGNKKLEEREKIQTQVDIAARGLHDTVTALGQAEATNNGALAEQLAKRAEEQRAAISNLEIRKAGIHTEAEADAQRSAMTILHSKQEAAQKANDQEALKRLAQEEAALEATYAGNTNEAKARAAQVIQKAQEAASKDALDVELNNIKRAEAEDGRRAQARLDAIAKERAVYAAQGLQNTPAARQLDVSQAQAERQLIDENYQEFAAKERLKIQELKGEPKAIAEVYNDWLSQLKNVYAQDEREYARVQREKVRATQQATQDSLQAEMSRVNTIIQVRNSELGLLKAQLGVQVDARRMSKAEEAGILIRATDDAAREEERLYQAIADRADAPAKAKQEAYQKIQEIATRAAEHEIQESKRVADEQKRDADRASRAYVSAFDNAGSSLERFLEAGVFRTQTLVDATKSLTQSIGGDVLRAVGSGLSSGAAHLISPNLEAGKGVGDLLGGWVSQGVGSVFGGGAKDAGQDALQAAAKASAEQLKIATDAQQRLNDLLGISQTATTASTLAKTTETTATGASTVAQGVDTTATTGGTLAKGLHTTAMAANTTAMTGDTAAVTANATAQSASGAASAAGGAASAAGGVLGGLSKIPIIGGLFSLLGGGGGAAAAAGSIEYGGAEAAGVAAGNIGILALSGGGLIPSAAGGMVVPGTGGGQMAILHPHEMVLPAPLSRGIQDMLGSDNRNQSSTNNVSADVRQTNTYNAGGSGGAFRTSDAERFFRQNGAQLAGEFRRAVAGGFRP